jgi:DNA-directed RNA polymerase subunit RPC12/RpoP
MTADPFGVKLYQEPTDLRRAVCPYCKKALKKIPTAKTKCPHCGGFMLVRTRPEDYARAVVTSTEAKRIEADYKILSHAREPNFRFIATERDVKAERERLKQSFQSRGHGEPSDDDVKWALLNQKAVGHAQDGDFGLSRNVYLAMGQFLARRWKLKDALGLYLYVSILDLNGANNFGGFKDAPPDLLKQFPPFDLRLACPAPAVLDQIMRIARKLQLHKEELHAAFEKRYIGKFPLAADECWSYLEKALWPAPSSLSTPVDDPASIARPPQSKEVEQILDLPGGRKVAVCRDARVVANDPPN